MKYLPSLRCRWLDEDQAKEQGYRPFFGHCSIGEEWMLKNTERDLRRAQRDYVAIYDIATERAMIYIR